MNPNLMEQFLGPSTQFFRFNSNDINVVVTPIDKKTCLLTKRNLIATTATTSAVLAAVNNNNNSNNKETSSKNSNQNNESLNSNLSSSNFDSDNPHSTTSKLIKSKSFTNGARYLNKKSTKLKLISSETSDDLITKSSVNSKYSNSNKRTDDLSENIDTTSTRKENLNELTTDNCKLIHTNKHTLAHIRIYFVFN